MRHVEWINNQYYNFNIHCYYTLQEMKYVYSLTRVGSAVTLYQKTKTKSVKLTLLSVFQIKHLLSELLLALLPYKFRKLGTAPPFFNCLKKSKIAWKYIGHNISVSFFFIVFFPDTFSPTTN